MEKVIADLGSGSRNSPGAGIMHEHRINILIEKIGWGNGMTEQRPGRKALFVGAPAPAGRSSPDEIAERVRGLNEDLALALKGAAANKAVKTLDASHFGSEYTTLVDAVNAALSKIAAATPGSRRRQERSRKVLVEYEKKIDVLERRLEFMEKNNPVPMLIATPSLDITEANAAYVTMSGIPESRILTTNIHDFAITSLSGEDAKVALEQKRRAVGELTVTFPSGVHTLEQVPVSRCLTAPARSRPWSYSTMISPPDGRRTRRSNGSGPDRRQLSSRTRCRSCSRTWVSKSGWSTMRT